MTDSIKAVKKVLDFKAIDKTTGTILGEKNGLVISLPEESPVNKNVAIFGAPGTGKSRGFSINHIIQCALRGESIIAADPKGELFHKTASYLRTKGFKVHVFDLVDPEYSDSWACLLEIISSSKETERMVKTFCNAIIMNTGGKANGDFWDNAERNIGTVYQMLVDNDETSLDALFDRLPKSHPAIQPYEIFKKAGRIAGNIMVGLGNRLSVLQNDKIKKITSSPEIDLEQPVKEKTAIFVRLSDFEPKLDFLSSLFFSFLFIRCVRYADTHGKCDVPVNFILDEFSCIGEIPNFVDTLSQIRSKGLSVSIIFQNIPQLQNRYPNGLWEELLRCCDVQLFLGCIDDTTAKYISELSKGMAIDGKQYREITRTDNKYLTPDDIIRFPSDECHIMIRGENIYRANKFDYSNHPEAKKFKLESIRNHVPQWRTNTETK